MRTISTCAGIGDSIWLFMKLLSANERFNWRLPDGKPQRGKQIFDLMPQISADCSYVPGLSYYLIDRRNIQRRRKLFSEVHADHFYLAMNGHLEAGRRIETFFPDLPTTYRIEYNTEIKHRLEAGKFFNTPRENKLFVGIYSSSYATSRNWGTWQEKEWVDLIKRIHAKRPDACFIIIGADWDVDLTTHIMHTLHYKKIPYISAVGQDLGVTIEILKRLDYFIGFPSGLSILNESLGKDGVMFYSKQIEKIINTWAHPERIANGGIKECVFCEPEKIFKWLVENNKI